MFTGIVEELGRVRRVEARAGGARLEIDAVAVLGDASIGSSNLAVTEPVTGTPFAFGAGDREVITGGVVSGPFEKTTSAQ